MLNLNFICRVPLVGDAVCWTFDSLIKLYAPLDFFLGRYKLIKRGRCSIWVPKSQKQLVLEGLDLMKTCDDELYSRLEKCNLLIYYSGKRIAANNGGSIYGLHEIFCGWGPEGVATFLVHSLFMYEASPTANTIWLTEDELLALKMAPHKVHDWMRKHSIRADFTQSYQSVVEDFDEKYMVGRFVRCRRKKP